MRIIVICLLMERKSLNLKPTMNMLTFLLSFASEVYLMHLVLLSLEKFKSLNANVDDFSIDYNSVDKCEMLNIRKYLKTKNNIK